MKRKSAPDHPDSVKRHPRQDPVSCESCRKRKLKCDRQQPCASCLSRRLTCTFHTHPPNTDDDRKPGGFLSTNSSIREPAIPCSAVETGSKESQATADWLEHIHIGDRVPAALSPQFRAELDEKPWGREESVGPARLLCSLTPNENPATVDLIQFLPSESDTAALFSYFCRYISYLYHIIVPRVVEGHINEVYRCVEHKLPANLNYLALLFAITGSSLFLQCSVESSRHAARCSQRFSFLTGAALTQANYKANPTIEGLQAVLITFHNISNIHYCTSVSGFFMIGSIIDQAKNMMLHRVDTPRPDKQEGRGPGPVELETRRRLWWDIASFDWYLGFLSGPQEWTYLVNPAFMCTARPSNIDDTDIGHSSSQPVTTPTSMSFFLERLKLADACRCIVETMSQSQLTGGEVEYSKILNLDRKIQETQAQCPDFLRLDPTSRRRYASLYQERPTLAWQRCILQQGYYSRLCRLHRPFFIRGARDPTYSYSYVAGLNAARKVLEIKRIMDEDEPRFTPSSSVIWSIVHHVFMAAVMLLLDVCYNGDDILAEKRKEEVLDACRMLSKAQQSSALVKEGIDGMMGVLQGHYRNGHPGTASGFPLGETVGSEGAGPPVAAEGLISPPVLDTTPAADRAGSHEDRDLEDIWSELIDHGGNMDFAGEDWTELFTDLTKATLPAS
ncbi:hypothetical protein BDW62DRAFT_219478 [Aspergillus aurantiobrunneus]